MVADAADGLRHGIHALSDSLRPYAEADDPLEALMIDIFNKRKLYNGNGYGGWGHGDDEGKSEPDT